MSTLHCVCLYCNFKWIAKYKHQTEQCIKCTSKNPRLIEIREGEKIDYYQGSPPFPGDKSINYYNSGGEY